MKSLLAPLVLIVPAALAQAQEPSIATSGAEIYSTTTIPEPYNPYTESSSSISTTATIPSYPYSYSYSYSYTSIPQYPTQPYPSHKYNISSTSTSSSAFYPPYTLTINPPPIGTGTGTPQPPLRPTNGTASSYHYPTLVPIPTGGTTASVQLPPVVNATTGVPSTKTPVPTETPPSFPEPSPTQSGDPLFTDKAAAGSTWSRGVAVGAAVVAVLAFGL